MGTPCEHPQYHCGEPRGPLTNCNKVHGCDVWGFLKIKFQMFINNQNKLSRTTLSSSNPTPGCLSKGNKITVLKILSVF